MTGAGAGIEVGDPIPEWVMPEVEPARMRTPAAILRDPNPVHWDLDVVRARRPEGRLVNQGPLNVGYLANMLMAWQGPDCVRRLQVRFDGRVFAGDRVRARGTVVEVDAAAGTAACEVWLERDDGSRPVHGVAVVAISRRG